MKVFGLVVCVTSDSFGGDSEHDASVQDIFLRSLLADNPVSLRRIIAAFLRGRMSH